MNKIIEMDGIIYDFIYEDLVWSIMFLKLKICVKEFV